MTVAIQKISAQDLQTAATPWVVLDARSTDDYLEGHIPGARHIEPLVFALPHTDSKSLSQFKVNLRVLLSALGLTVDQPVAVVGASNEVNASRVVWALAYAGIRQIAIVDKGYAAWTGPLSEEVPAVVATVFVPDFQEKYLTPASALNSNEPSDRVLLDAREWADYAAQKTSAKRAGRIPGARFWDTAKELDTQGHLQTLFAADLPASDSTVIYCGGGGRAARTFVALQLAGHRQASVYPSSWGEWGNSDVFPIESNVL